MSLGTISESYTLHSEYKRVVHCAVEGYLSTRMKIWTDGSEYFPEWQHSVMKYTDTSPQNDPETLVRLWENKLLTAQTPDDLELEEDY